jgi:hypothetical protein
VKNIAGWIVVAAFIAGCGQTGPRSTAGTPTVDLWTATATGNVEAIQQHVSAGTDLNAKEPANGSTPLIVAAVFGQTEAAGLLVKNGVEVDARNNDGSTALLTAAFFCHQEIVQLLLESGADVNAKNNAGRTPLDTVSAAWSPELEGTYTSFAESFQIQLDLGKLRSTRPVVADMLRKRGGKPGSEL